MLPFTVNGEVWHVEKVSSGDPRLIDRTGVERLATTDPLTRTVHISGNVAPPQLDRVVLHEVAHAVTISYHLLDTLRAVVPEQYWVFVEEWAVQLVENYGLEATRAAMDALGRPLCIGGYCVKSRKD